MEFAPMVKRLRKHNRTLKRMLMEVENQRDSLEARQVMLEQTIKNRDIEIDILRRYLAEAKAERTGE